MDAIRINKHDSKVLKWLQSAASKDTESILAGINSNGNNAACDGWRLHIVPPTDLVELPDGTRQYGKIPADGLVELPDAQEGTYPEYNQIIPQGEPVLEIGVNPQFLIDALKGFLKSDPEMVRLRFHDTNKPMELFGKIETKDGTTPGYALIMPMHIGDNNDTWKP